MEREALNMMNNSGSLPAPSSIREKTIPGQLTTTRRRCLQQDSEAPLPRPLWALGRLENTGMQHV